MDNKQLERAIQSIGKKSFVEDYDVYSNPYLKKDEKVKILSKKYSVAGASIRVSNADRIFINEKQQEALKLIIDSQIIGKEIREKAKILIK